MRPSVARLLLALSVVLASSPAGATDYYVASHGSDAAAGTSPADAWETVARVTAADLDPSDRVLFEGGTMFAGNLVLDAADAGTPVMPVVLTSFGSGRATIDGTTGTGIFVDDAAGIEIRDLNVVGDGPATNTGYGILFATLRSDGAKLEYVRIDKVDVSGFREGGIVLSSDHASLPGYRDVEITNANVFQNGQTGINVGGFFVANRTTPSHENIYIAHVNAYENHGDPTNRNGHTGSGIIVSATDGAVIEFCRAWDNGGINSQNSGGPVGIWTWHSTNVTIQYNIAHHNKTGGGADGGGFDLDGGVSNSVIQYNYSYENEGAGYLLAQFSLAGDFKNNVIRYNVSYNDGRRNSYGGFVLFSDFFERIEDTEIYGNTVYLTPAARGVPRAVHAFFGTYANVNFRNNIFMTAPGVQLVRTFLNHPPGGLGFQGNLYWIEGGGFDVDWGGTSYTSLADWRAMTGQEMAGGHPVGLHADPKLTNPGSPELLTDPTRLVDLLAYHLREDSPAIEGGLDLMTLFGIDPGPHDFYGKSVPQGLVPDIGADEFPARGGVGVTGRRLVLLDKLGVNGTAKAVYVSRDAKVSKGTGTDVTAVGATFEVIYNGARVSFDVPAGRGWTRNTERVAKYVNKQAPSGPSSVRRALVRAGKQLRLLAKSLGDSPVDLVTSGRPDGPVYTAFTVVNGVDTVRHCSQFAPADCTFKEIAGGAGRRLRCERGAADPACTATP